MQRRVYCVGLRKHVEADIDDIVPITGKRGTKYQCVGKYSENGKDYVVKSWVPKADYEALHGPVLDIAAAESFSADVEMIECGNCDETFTIDKGLDIGGIDYCEECYDTISAKDPPFDAEEFIGADVEAAEPLAADPVADSPVAEDSSEPLEVAPADKSYFLSESVVLSAIKEMSAEYHYEPFLNYGSFAHTPCQAEIVFDIDDAGTSKENTGKCEECGEIITIEKDEWDRIQAHMMGEMDLDFYVCISCGEEMDEEDGHELVGEFQEKCCLPCFKSAFGAEDECSSCKGTGTSDYYAPCELCMGNMEFDDMECRDCHGSGASDYYAPCEECSLPRTPDYTAEQTFEAQQKDRKDEISEKAALNLITNSYGVKRIVSGPTYYRFVAGTSSKFLMFAVVERNNGTYQAVNVYGRRGANFPTLWTSDIYQTQMQAERASKAKQEKKSRKGYVFLDAEEFTAFMAEHFNSETLNSSESIDNYMSESPLDESPVDEDPLTAEPSDMGGPEDFSADATIDLEDGEITIHEKGAKSGSKKKLLLGVILVAGLAAAYQNSDAVLSFFEGLKGDDDIDAVVGCMDETANNYDPAATEDDGSCTYDEDPEPTA